ncbi:MAG TPA: Crp/Fnr family transcriptional regulator [Alphaproteobacteria bacterium]|nr:Crp/Fnr family transcriptional regulator [Alphaproteobacteria bacterium]
MMDLLETRRAFDPAPESDPVERAISMIGGCEILAAFSQAGRRNLAAKGTIVGLQPGEILFARGDKADACYAVLDGQLDIFVADSEGQETWIAAFVEGALIGSLGMLNGRLRSVTAQAGRSSRLLRVCREDALAALIDEPKAAAALISHLAARLGSVDALGDGAHYVGLAARLSDLLLKHGSHPIRLSSAELGRQIDASADKVARKLLEWCGAGLIEIGTAGVRVANPSRLAAYAKTSDMA